jgi:DNA-binding transcriptional LysR family regulator
VSTLNYKHLYYFWTVARTGGVTRASERLHVTPQTISGQIGAFEDVLGFKLFERVGRRLELTDAGRVAVGYADAIFTLGGELEADWRHRPKGRLPTFRAGISDVMPKSVAYGLLEPVLRQSAAPHIVCREGKLASQLGDLAVHRLDIVFADRPMPVTAVAGTAICSANAESRSSPRLRWRGGTRVASPATSTAPPLLLPAKTRTSACASCAGSTGQACGRGSSASSTTMRC